MIVVLMCYVFTGYIFVTRDCGVDVSLCYVALGVRGLHFCNPQESGAYALYDVCECNDFRLHYCNP